MNELISSPENRGEKKKKFDFAQKKENTIRSLSEVEHFLCNLNQVVKGVKIFKILRK